MSLVQSISIDSTSSTGTMATLPSKDFSIHGTNELYENRDHFQAIFTNDSRFFDTSLHLYKSYASLGYIPFDDGPQKQHQRSLSTTTSSSGHKDRWRPRLFRSIHNEKSNGTLKAFLTPTLLRKKDRSPSIRSFSSPSPNGTNPQPEKPSAIVQFHRQIIPIINVQDEDNQSDESEITITRL